MPRPTRDDRDLLDRIGARSDSATKDAPLHDVPPLFFVGSAPILLLETGNHALDGLLQVASLPAPYRDVQPRAPPH